MGKKISRTLQGLICSFIIILPGWLIAAELVPSASFQAIPGPLPAQLDTQADPELPAMSNRALQAALRARHDYFAEQGLQDLAKPALEMPTHAAQDTAPLKGLSAELLEAGLTSIAGTTDEPTGEVALPVDLAQSCPGFYILRTHPGAGSLAGRVGAEILLDGSGLRTLQGGLNFGGQATASIRGFSAFSIANANDEDQVVNIGLDAAASGRLVLERRSGGTTTIIIDRAVAAGETDVSATVAPGFYVVGYQPNRSQPTDYTVAALTSFTNRSGGGFQGGVVFGGYHNPARESTGFGGFCIAEAFDVSVSILSRPTYGSSGARGLAFSVSSGDGTVFLDSRDGSGGGGGGGGGSGGDQADSCAAVPPSQAGFLTLGGTLSVLQGRIDPASDVDFFDFEINQAAEVSIESSSTTVDTIGRLYDQNCNLITSDDDSGDGLNFFISENLNAGRYFFSVESFAGISTGDYSILIRGQAIGDGGGDVTSTFQFNNELLYSVDLEINGQVVGSAPPEQISTFAYSGPPSASVTWDLNRPRNPSGTPVGEDIRASFNPVNVTNGSTITFDIDSQVGNQPYFVPVIFNREAFGLSPTVNAGFTAEVECPCSIPAFGTAAIGYYRLFSDSNVRLQRNGTSDAYIITNFLNSVQSGSGRTNLEFDL